MKSNFHNCWQFVTIEFCNALYLLSISNSSPVPVAERSKVRVCSSSLVGIAGSNPAGGKDACLVSVVCCQVAVSATG